MSLIQCISIGDVMPDARALVAANIKALCEREGFSKAGLARHCGVKSQHVSRWLAGSLPTQYFDEIATYFDIKVADLFLDPEDKSPPSTKIDRTLQDAVIKALNTLAPAVGYSVTKTKK